MKIAVIGADGQLGSDITSKLKKDGFSVNELFRKDIDISDRNSVNNIIVKKTDSDLIINTAAFHHVRKSENDPVTSFKVNGIGAANLAYACRETKKKLIHISTDYVFDGTKGEPYIETDLPNPVNVYGNSKLSGEYFIRSIMEDYHILRLSGIYGSHICIGKGYNFVDKILKIGEEKGEVKVVTDEVLTPTFTEDIAEQVSLMISKNCKTGVYHVSAEGSCSWYEFAKEIFRIKDNGVKVKKALSGEFGNGVIRPACSVLENRYLKDQGINIIPHWKDGLERYIKLYR